jgi:hypothetical protein
MYLLGMKVSILRTRPSICQQMWGEGDDDWSPMGYYMYLSIVVLASTLTRRQQHGVESEIIALACNPNSA